MFPWIECRNYLRGHILYPHLQNHRSTSGSASSCQAVHSGQCGTHHLKGNIGKCCKPLNQIRITGVPVSQVCWGEGRVTAWMSHKVIIGTHRETNNHSLSRFRVANEPEVLGKSQRNHANTCKCFAMNRTKNLTSEQLNLPKSTKSINWFPKSSFSVISSGRHRFSEKWSTASMALGGERVARIDLLDLQSVDENR